MSNGSEPVNSVAQHFQVSEAAQARIENVGLTERMTSSCKSENK